VSCFANCLAGVALPSTQAKFGTYVGVIKDQSLHGKPLEELYYSLKAGVKSAELNPNHFVVPTKAWVFDTKLYVRRVPVCFGTIIIINSTTMVFVTNHSQSFLSSASLSD
jgi:hypothetical protein